MNNSTTTRRSRTQQGSAHRAYTAAAQRRCSCKSTVVNLHRKKKCRREPGRDVKILLSYTGSDPAYEEGPIKHSRCTYINLHALLMNNSTTTTRRTENAFEKRRQSVSACLYVFFIIMRGGDDAIYNQA